MKSSIRLARAVFGIILFLSSASHRAAAQPANYRSQLDSLFTILDTNHRMMGSVTIRKGDRVLYTRAIGYRDSTAAGWTRSDDHTRYRIGSVTKPFTAVLIYQLIDEKKLSLDTKVSKFFPTLAVADSITVRDLLGHTSGLPDYTHGMDPMVALDRNALLERMSKGPLKFRPGAARRYSNSNFLLLGWIIEAVTGSPYDTQLQERICKRIGLARTHFGGPVEPGADDSRAYLFGGGHWTLQPDHAIQNAGGAGGIASTSSDLTHFLSALFQGKLISASSLKEMTNGFDDGTRKSGKGIGPFTIPGTKKAGFSHDGSIGAHAALIGYVPEDSLALALTINGHNYPMRDIFFLVWDILYGVPAPLPSFTPASLPDAAAASFAGAYSADDWGIKITIRRAGSGMEGQTEGQDPFPLVYVGRNRFVFDSEGILIEFERSIDGMAPRFTLYQQLYAIPLARVKAP